MKAAAKQSQEPMGIVIAGMPEVPEHPVFSAYIWGPAPSKKDSEPKSA